MAVSYPGGNPKSAHLHRHLFRFPLPEPAASAVDELIEKTLFNDFNFIEKNTFVTSHQMSNIYTDAQKLYEVRIDENSVDIQINSN